MLYVHFIQLNVVRMKGLQSGYTMMSSRRNTPGVMRTLPATTVMGLLSRLTVFKSGPTTTSMSGVAWRMWAGFPVSESTTTWSSTCKRSAGVCSVMYGPENPLENCRPCQGLSQAKSIRLYTVYAEQIGLLSRIIVIYVDMVIQAYLPSRMEEAVKVYSLIQFLKYLIHHTNFNPVALTMSKDTVMHTLHINMSYIWCS